MSRRIPIAGPSIGAAEIAAVTEAAASAWYEGAGTCVARFEADFAAHLGRAHAMAVPHCTAALHLAFAGLGLGPGDEVIVPETTWIATAAPLAYVGATPVFADIDPVTWCIDPASAAACVTERTRAILPVGLYGLCPDMDALGALADRHGLTIVEDAAQALGASLRGRKAGSFGAAACFSFHGTKLVTTGEGGMVVTDDDALAERMGILRDHGRTKANHRMFWNTEVAFKYRMSDLQAALGTAQMARIDDLVARKRQIFGWYRDRLADLPGLHLNAEPEGHRNSYWMTTAVIDPELGLTTPVLMDALADRGIDSRPFFHPLSALPAYAGAPGNGDAARRNPVAHDLAGRAVNLPSALTLTEADVDRVATALRGILARA